MQHNAAMPGPRSLPRRVARRGLDRLLAQRGMRLAALDDVADPFRMADFTPELTATWERVRPYTLTSPEKVAGLIGALEHVVEAGIPGAFVECGVWRAGSSMAAAITLLRVRDPRDLYLFDTYQGMPKPDARDVDFRGVPASRWWDPDHQRRASVEHEASIAHVQARMLALGYPADRLHLVAGMVQDTVPARAPDTIAVLRLDTDFYDSTKHELEQLWPRLSDGGILIVDDYGHFRGAREAVDEFFGQAGARPYMHRLDYSGRLIVR
jgi:hypothetical protein